MTCFRSLFVVCPALCLLAQTPAPVPKPAAPKPAAAKPAAAKPAQKKAVTTPKPAAPAPAATTPAVNAAPQATPPPPPPPEPLANVPPDQVVLTVGDEKFTARDFLQILSILPEQARTQTASPQGRRQFVENLIRVKVLAQEGRRRKVDQTPKFQTQMMLQREEFLANNTYASLQESASVTEEMVKDYYNQHKTEFDTVRASHILIRFKGSPVPMKSGQKDLTEEQALAKANGILKELNEGGDFPAIARRDSDDGGSGAYGGDLGTFSRGRMVPSFEDVAFKLPIGQLSQPVKTNFGYHIIKVTARDAKTYEQAKADIEKKLRPEAAMRTMESIRKSTNVVIAPELSGETPAPAAAPQPAAPAK
jgi:peptidyl-prolyl cis-trans isomerase C